MSVKFRDYYESLGVARTATAEEIQRAYRSLARKHHPDVTKEPGAEQRFAEISEAYEVLKDPEKRKRYDTLGANWRAGQEFTPPTGWEEHFARGGRRGASPGGSGRFDVEDLHDLGGFSDFFETLFGDRFAGARAGHSPRGRAAPRRAGRSIEGEVSITLEEAHRGVSRAVTLRLDDQHAESGRTKTYTVKIPRGATDGAVIRLAGQGEAGARGGPAGDLLLKVRIEPHPTLRLIRERDLETTLPISPWEAALGAKVNVHTLDGPVTLTIPVGSQSGQKLRLRGRGLAARGDAAAGDLIVELKIVVPTTLSDEERKLLEEWGRVSTFRPRSGSEG